MRCLLLRLELGLAGLPEAEAQHVGQGFELLCLGVSDAVAGLVVGKE